VAGGLVPKNVGIGSIPAVLTVGLTDSEGDRDSEGYKLGLGVDGKVDGSDDGDKLG
jgi:hypothetical protein